MAERVWDKFLTEQDKRHLAASGHRNAGFGERPALLMIDLYRWVFGDRPQPLLEAIKEWPGSCGPAAWESLPHIQSLLAAAREVGMPVVHVTGLADSESGVRSWAGARHSRGGGSGYLSTASAPDEKRGRMYDIVDELAPLPGEAFLRKASPSAFFGTPLVAHLNNLGVDTLIVAGESTSGCVRASVVDGCTYRYRMVVVEECVFDRHETTHALNLFDMHHKYADVVSLAEATEWMRSWQAPAGYAAPQPAGARG
jgi:maleamate amidohydrolase